MKEAYKRNETCIIGLPRCDYVFNSNRSCFIAYGFEESKLEMEILRSILKDNNIEVFEAGGDLQPGKNAFCTKICSKIITSQFVIVLLNQDTRSGIKMPNANINMEYGLMLGFNKYIVPFQRKDDILPFNVAGLDTIKYSQSDFKQKAENAIKIAIEQTKPKTNINLPVDRIIEMFLNVKNALLCSIEDEGSKNVHALGSPFNYFLLNDYTGLKYYYLGVFNNLSIDAIKYRIGKLQSVVSARFSEEALKKKIELGAMNAEGMKASLKFLKLISCWIIVRNEEEKKTIISFTKNTKIPVEVFSLTEINQEIEGREL